MTLTKPSIASWLAVAAVVIFANGCGSSKKESNTEFAFGAIADCQYCTIKGTAERKYSLSVDKLEKTVAHFNTMDLTHVVHLGDFIDRDFENFDVVNPIFNQLRMPKYHVLGNHDFSVLDDLKKEVPLKMGMPSKYYDFEIKGWRYIVLDGNDLSFYAYPKDSEGYRKSEEYYITNKITSEKWNGAIGPEQQHWLKDTLNKATQNNEKVILLCHFPIYPKNEHNLWNAEEIVSIIESYPCVKAYMNGHNHAGNYATKEGIHYLTLKGMVNTEQTSYAVIRVGDKRIRVTGFGREEDRIMLNRKSGQ